MARGIIFLALLLGVCFSFSGNAYANKDQYLPNNYGVALLTGSSYDPDQIGMVMVQGHVVADYKRFFLHRSPPGLRLKVEANLGLTTDGRQRSLFSLNMLALRYFDNWSVGTFIPYFEAGIGVIYTDFRVAGQGSRINFNPQLGVGFKVPLDDGSDSEAISLGLRLHHVSNANLLKDNRGVNSVFLMVGYQF